MPNVVSPTAKAQAEAESTDAPEADSEDAGPTTRTATIPVGYAPTGASSGFGASSYATGAFSAYNAAGKTVVSGAMGGLVAVVAAMVAL